MRLKISIILLLVLYSASGQKRNKLFIDESKRAGCTTVFSADMTKSNRIVIHGESIDSGKITIHGDTMKVIRALMKYAINKNQQPCPQH